MTEPPSAEKVLNTYRKVAFFYSALEKLAAKYEAEDDKGRSALEAIGLTVRFLQQLNVDRSLMAALVEAQLIIERSIDGGRTAAKQRMERNVVDSVAVELQRQGGVKLEDAVRNVVGNDPKAVQELRDFRKNVRAGRNIAARTHFQKYMKLYQGAPSQAAIKRALRMCANLRGKKV